MNVTARHLRSTRPAGAARPLESVTATAWSAADEQFFRITVGLFPPPFLLGATVLLASNDDELDDAAAAARAAVAPT